jgi:hypothetical protein
MAFSFTVSSHSVTLNPNGTVSITITQTSTAPQTVRYGISTKFAGGWDASTYIDQYQQVTYAFGPTPASLTGNGTLTLTFAASSVVIPQTLVVTVYGIQQMTGDPNSALTAAQTITITIT